MVSLALLVVVIAAIGPVLNYVSRVEFTVHSKGAILITGGNSGIGLAACYSIAERHPTMTVFCSARTDAAASKVVKNARSENVRSVILDIAKPEQIKSAVTEIRSTGIPIVGLVNNAGYAKIGTIEHQPYEQIRQMMETNYFGTFLLTREMLPDIRKNKGRVVTVGSTIGVIPTGHRMSGYGATKYAVESFTHALRNEVQDLGVSVSVVRPGVVATGMQGDIIDKAETDLKNYESRTYPHLFTEKWEQKFKDFAFNADTPDETVGCIEDALFNSHPRTSYVSAVMGPMPSWLFLRIAWLLPDRVMDAMNKL